MKQKYGKLFLIAAVLIGTGFSQALYGALIKTTAKTLAVIGYEYKYDVNVFPIGDSAFVLEKGLVGMTIGASSGIITWTPQSLSQGGEVIVRATVGGFSETQTFFIYISDALVCDEDMISYWKLDEASGTTFADFKGGFNAITGVSPTATPGIVGNGQIFDPALDIRLSVPDNGDQYGWLSGESISGAVWFKSAVDINSNTGPQVFMGRLGNSGSTTAKHWWWFGLDTNNYVHMEVTNEVGTLTEGDPGYPNVLINHSSWGVYYSDDVWHFAVFTLQGNASNQYNLKIYVDGVLAQAGTANKTFLAGDFTNPTSEFNLGWWQTPWANKFEFKGSLDEPAIYSRVLEAQEIADMYNDGLAAIAYCQPGNYAPLFESAPVTAASEDVQYTYNISTRDIDVSDVLSITKVSGPAWLTTFTDNGNGTATLRGTPSNSDVGSQEVTLRVSDSNVEIDQIFNIAVANVNDKPVFTSTAVTAAEEDEVYTYAITTQDVDAGSTMSISTITTLPSWLTMNDNGDGTATLTGTPLNDNVGTIAVTLRVTDDASTSNDQSFIITVSNKNDAPVITGQNDLSINEESNIVLSLNDLTVTDVDNNYPDDFGLAILAGDNYTFSGTTVTPVENFNGNLTVNIELSDLSTTIGGTMTVEVAAINDLPVITSEPVLAAATGTQYTYWISATDIEDENITFEAITKPAWATFTYNAAQKLGLLQGTPSASDANIAAVSIKVTDSDGGTDTQNFEITVTGGATAIDDINSGYSVKIYPVPVKEFAFVETGADFKGSVQIFNLSGTMVKEVEVNKQSVIKIDLSDLKTGQYICRLVAADKISIGKIIKE